LRPVVLILSLLVVALLHAITLVPRTEVRQQVSTTEEIRTSHGHHHKTMASFTDDTNDDDDDDDDDDVLASSLPIVVAPVTVRSHGEIVFTIDDTLGPSSAHQRFLERPPRG
jgi:hypothetical protein